MSYGAWTHLRLPSIVAILAVALLGCGSSTSSTGQAPGSAGSAGSGGSPGTGGETTRSGAGGATGGTSAAGTFGAAGSQATAIGGGPTGGGGVQSGTDGGGGAQPGTAGMTSTGGGAGGSGTKGPPSCTLLVGPTPLGQWFHGGFLGYPGIDTTKWQAMVVGHHYIPDWSPPGSALWNSPLDGTQRCAINSNAPDRVIFHATQWSAMPLATWEMHFSGIVKNIQAKWPSAKRIELMLSTVGPTT